MDIEKMIDLIIKIIKDLKMINIIIKRKTKSILMISIWRESKLIIKKIKIFILQINAKKAQYMEMNSKIGIIINIIGDNIKFTKDKLK